MGRRRIALALGLASAALAGPRTGLAQDRPAPAAPARAPERPGSVVTTAPLGPGRVGMSLGGGLAVLLPYYGFELGVGLSRRVDVVGRFESVVGVLHYPHVGIRYSPFELGRWKIGTRLLAHYSFFGIDTDQLNLTSTFYLSGDLAISGPVTDETDLVLGATGELDLFEHRVVDGDATTEGTYRYDATIGRLGIRTRLTRDLDGYAFGRLRVPTETFTYEATSFYVLPSLEIGGTWSF